MKQLKKYSNVFLPLLLGLLSCQAIKHADTGSMTPNLNLNEDGAIIDGYDPVAFFSDQKPVKGNPDFRSTYNGATYWFATRENQQLFEKNPSRYEVQFGGWCAYAVSLGTTAPIDINTWSIIKDRLVFQKNDRIVKIWNKNPDENYEKANANWPAIARQKDKN